jgi:transposase InsO family protein
MGQLLHGSARMTAAVRRAIHHRHESLAKLAKRYALTPKTVAQWKNRSHVDDAPMGPKPCHSTGLPLAQEALIVALRRHTLLPLDACLSALPATLPHLTRAALHRGLQRHGSSRLPEMAHEKPGKKKFTASPIGSFHVDIAEGRTEEGKLALLVAIDRACKFASAELHADATNLVAAEVLRNLRAAIPYKIHTVLTDNSIQFTNRNRDSSALHQIFDRVGQEYGIDPRLTTTNHPWTNGQVERMNRTLKEATVTKYDSETHDHLTAPLQTFLMADHVAKRLKTLKGLTPYEHICKCWQEAPERLAINPYHHTLGLNI